MYTQFLVLIISLILVAGCQPTDSANTTPKAQHTQTLTSKTSGPVQISYRFLETPVLNTPIHIELVLRSSQPGTAIQLSYQAKGMTLLESTDITLPAIAANTRVSHTITVLAQTEGEFRLVLTATLLTADGQEQSTTHLIPIRIGNIPNPAAALEKSNTHRTTDMPAQETRHR